jgi:hypothetical protein
VLSSLSAASFKFLRFPALHLMTDSESVACQASYTPNSLLRSRTGSYKFACLRAQRSFNRGRLCEFLEFCIDFSDDVMKKQNVFMTSAIGWRHEKRFFMTSAIGWRHEKRFFMTSAIGWRHEKRFFMTSANGWRHEKRFFMTSANGWRHEKRFFMTSANGWRHKDQWPR